MSTRPRHTATKEGSAEPSPRRVCRARTCTSRRSCGTPIRDTTPRYGRSTPAWTGSVSTYLDLYLIHWPLPERNTFVETFKAFANLRDQGRIRSIGVSNFEPEHLRILVDATGIVPAVNQVELHPLLQQQELREVHAQLGVATEAWAPLGQGALLDNPTVTSVAERYGKTPAQVLIRWHIQLGNIVIPKSVTPERIVSNFDVFDLELSEQDMASISSLGDGTRLGPDPRTFDFTG